MNSEQENIDVKVFDVLNRKISRFNYQGKDTFLLGDINLTEKVHELVDANKYDLNNFQDCQLALWGAIRFYLKENPTELMAPTIKMYDIKISNSDTCRFDTIYTLLMVFGGYSSEDANDITNKIHEEGEALIGPFTLEISQTFYAALQQSKKLADYEFDLPIELIPHDDGIIKLAQSTFIKLINK